MIQLPLTTIDRSLNVKACSSHLECHGSQFCRLYDDMRMVSGGGPTKIADWLKSPLDGMTGWCLPLKDCKPEESVDEACPQMCNIEKVLGASMFARESLWVLCSQSEGVLSGAQGMMECACLCQASWSSCL